MRIAYITIHVAPEIMRGGVGNKIKTQIDIWREQGNQVTLFSLTPAEIPFANEQQFIFKAKTNLLARETNRMSGLKRMLQAIQKYKPDIIYLRFGLYSYPLHHIFKIAPTIIEINSNDIAEYRSRGQFFYWINRLTRNLTLAPACGYIFPTYELAEEFQVSSEKYVQVISNGIDIKGVKVLAPTNHKHPVITLVGSPGMNWHGVDKLIQLANVYPDIKINIVGYTANDISVNLPTNVILHGFLNKDNLFKVLSKTDVACGTLALHRKNMEEACPLKVREALLHGIPLVLGYKDTDLDHINSETILKIPNTEDNVMTHSEQIYKFAYAMLGKRVNLDEVLPFLDQRKKEETRLAFFYKILEQCK